MSRIVWWPEVSLQAAEFRPEPAYPQLTENTVSYNHGHRFIDLFIVLEGHIDIRIPTPNSDSRLLSQHQQDSFSG